MTGNCDNFLATSFAKNENTEHNLEVIEVQITNTKKDPSFKDEVLKQVLTGLESINQALRTYYKLSFIIYHLQIDVLLKSR